MSITLASSIATALTFPAGSVSIVSVTSASARRLQTSAASLIFNVDANAANAAMGGGATTPASVASAVAGRVGARISSLESAVYGAGGVAAFPNGSPTASMPTQPIAVGPSTLPPSTPSAAPAAAATSNNTGDIAGGIIGALVGIALISVGVLWYLGKLPCGAKKPAPFASSYPSPKVALKGSSV